MNDYTLSFAVGNSRIDEMDVDHEKIDDCTLALLHLVSFKEGLGVRAWKSFDWETMNRLHEKGYISDPKNKNKSVVLSEEGGARAEELFKRLFAK
jgi:hypothetical protein